MNILSKISEYIKSVDKILICLAVISTIFGEVLIFSATNTSGTRNIIVQSLCLFIGIIAMIFISKFDYNLYEDIALIIYIICVIGLVVTCFVAKEINGNRNWIDLGFFNLQTSEIAKVGFIITMSVHISKFSDKISSPKSILFILLHFIGYAAPIVVQGDIGTLLIYTTMFIVLLFIGRLHWLYFAGGVLFALCSTPLIWNFFLEDYMKERILIAINPQLDPLGIGYQQVQSMMAIGGGQMNGMGLFNGVQTQYNLLPEKHTDFIFSVAGEELGFIGAMAIIILLSLLMIRIIYISMNSTNNVGVLICSAVVTMIAAQSIENIGMCLGVLPVIGVTLPFFSYGGSSLISMFCSIGLCLSVSMNSRKFTFIDKDFN